MQTIDLALLATVTGAGGASPFSGDVRQDINTNWGGSQTNIKTQIINQPPHAPTTVTEYWRQHPELRMQKAKPVRRPWF
ncbi:MAG TPA: hypothetical protein VL326_24165 [Kofleriaceae bacterium]|nr:hypothetical protein [Kofleriaceae bacterium]